MTHNSTQAPRSSRTVFVLGLLVALVESTAPFAVPAMLAQGDTPPPEEAPQEPARDLPAGHPPVGSGTQTVIPPVPEGAGTGETGLAWETPEGWTSEPPSSSMRRAQYSVDGPGGPAECVVFYFGPGQGGSPEANAQRWAGQFTGPEGGPAPSDMRRFETNGVRILEVEARGTYNGGMRMGGRPAAQELSDYMLLGAIAEGPDANWFFKLTGPRATVEANKEAFQGMIRSLSAGSSGS